MKRQILILSLILGVLLLFGGCSGDDADVSDKEIEELLIRERFEDFAAYWCEFGGIPMETAGIEMLKEVKRVPFEGGEFVFYDMAYSINGRLEQVDPIGDIQVIYYEKDGVAQGIEFISGSINHYEEYVDAVYGNWRDFEVKEEYVVSVGAENIGLYQDVTSEAWISDLDGEVQVAAGHGEGYVSTAPQFCKKYVTQDYEICVLEWLEGMKETVHKIVLRGEETMTSRGIRVGDSENKLMSAYPEDLYPLEPGHPLGEGYAYLPKDGTSCYIFFQITDGVIEQITLSVGYGGRPLELDE